MSTVTTTSTTLAAACGALRALLLCAALILPACSDEGSPGSDAGADHGPVLQDGRADAPKPPREAGSEASVKQDQGPKPDAKQPAHWERSAGPLPGRWDHTATTLKNGRVLVVGGAHKPKGVEYLADTQLYLPVARTFQAAGSLKDPRADHTATLLSDGRVLVAGGQTSGGKGLSSCELFDPSKSGAAAWSVGPSLFAQRINHAAVRLGDGRVLVAGGYNNASQHLSSLAFFQPKSGSWAAPAAQLKNPRVDPTLTVLKSGKVLIVGGYGGPSNGYPAVLELFDPATNSVTALSAKLSQGRAGHTATLLPDGKVLIVGGYCGSGCAIKGDALYDPQSNTVSDISHAGDPPAHHAACPLGDGRVLITGGGNSAGTKAMAFSIKGGGVWQALAPMQQARHQHTCSVLGDGSVLVVGGKEGSPGTYGTAADKAERYFP